MESKEIEMALLGALLVSGEQVGECAGIVTTSDFQSHAHRWVWDALVGVDKRGGAIDIVTVSAELQNQNTLNDVGGTAYLAKLMLYCANSLHAAEYARAVKQSAARRALMALATELAQGALSPDKSPYSIAADFQKSLGELSSTNPGLNPLSRNVKTAYELGASEPRPPCWLTYKFIERGELVLLTAPGGSMKSMLMLDWAVCVAAGVNWLASPIGHGGRICQESPVLWINTDNGEQTHANRLRALMAARALDSIPLYSLTTTDFLLGDAAHINHLLNLADDTQAEVIVIDTLSGALTGLDENAAQEMTAPAAHLRALANSGRTILCIHHPPKADVNGSRGSSVLPNKADRVFSLSRQDDLLTLKSQKIRNSPTDSIMALASLEFGFDESLTSARFFDGNATRQERTRESEVARIREALDGQALNVNQLAARAKMSKGNLRAALDDLLKCGAVKMEDGARGSQIYSLK